MAKATADAGERDARPTRFLPTVRIAFPKQLEIIRAFGALYDATSKPVTNAEVAKIVDMSPSTVSLANPFFVDIELLQKTSEGFIPAAEVVAFTKAHAWNPETAPFKLGPLFARTWFYPAITPKLTFGPATVEEIVSRLAEAVSAAPAFKRELENVLDFMAAAGLVVRENGHVRSGTAPDASPHRHVEPTPAHNEPREQQPVRHASSVATSFANPTAGLVQFQVSVKVDMQEMAAWRPDRITAFFAGIAQVLAAKGAIEEGSAAT